MVVVKFLVFVSEVVSIFSKILTCIIGGAKGYLCSTNSIIGGRVPRLPPKSTPMVTTIVELRIARSISSSIDNGLLVDATVVCGAVGLYTRISDCNYGIAEFPNWGSPAF